MKTKSFENLTVVSVTGSLDYAQGSIYAIMRSCRELKGAKGLLICPPLPPEITLPDNIEHITCAPFSYLEYNLFMLYQLDDFIHTDYCLVVQNDGWVLNGQNWRDEFWDYDYIGANVPTYCYFKNNTWYSSDYKYYMENLHLRDNPNLIKPQNGGFSLRSKRLLGLPRQLGIDLVISPPKSMKSTSEPYKIQWENSLHHEDNMLTVIHRRTLEQQGIRFAPENLADLFSVESVALHDILNIPFDSVFGCHFFGNAILIGENKLKIKVASHILHQANRIEDLFQFKDIKMLADLGYEMELIPL